VRFLVADIAQFSVATAVLAAFLIVPGYVVGRATGALSFRSRSPLEQFLLSVALSVSAVPIVTYLTLLVGGWHGVAVVFGAVWLVFVTQIVWKRRRLVPWLRELFGDGVFRPMLLVAALWFAIALVSLVDMPVGSLLYRGGPYYDHIAHTAIIDAVVRSGVPPANPFFHPGHPIDVVYYHLWYLVGGVAWLSGGAVTTERAASLAGTVWAGWSFFAIVALLLRELGGRDAQSVDRRVRMALFVAFVGGLDALIVVPNDIFYAVTGHGFYWDHAEMWNFSGSVTMWITVFLWSPHHTVAFAACVFGFLLLREPSVGDGSAGGARRAILAGSAFASSAGMSIWVTLVAALILLPWLGVLVRRRWWSELRTVIYSGMVSVALAAPFLIDLQLARLEHSLPVAFAVRVSQPVTRALTLLGFEQVGILELANLVALIPTYAVELGFVMVAPLLWWSFRRRAGVPLDRDDRFLMTMFIASMVVSSFLCSVIRHNDLGWRGIMFAQLALLIWSTDVAAVALNRDHGGVPGLRDQLSRRWKRILVVLIAVGIASTGYQVLKLRLHEPVFDLVRGGAHGRETAALRTAYEWIDQHLPRDAVIQYSPLERAPASFNGLYGNRQVVYDETYAYTYGVPEWLYGPVKADLARVWSPTVAVDSVDILCARYGIDAVVVTAADTLWADRASWIWRRQAAYENSHARVVLLGAGAR